MMNFFSQMNDLLHEGIPLKVVIAKNKDRIAVSVIPDSDDPDLVPATISGNPDEVDSAFFAAMTGAINSGNVHANQKMVKAAAAKKGDNKNEIDKKEEKKEPDLFNKEIEEKPRPKPVAEPEPEPEKEPEPPAEDVKPVAKGFRAPRAEAAPRKEEEAPWEEPKEPEKTNDVEPESSETVFDDDDDWS